VTDSHTPGLPVTSARNEPGGSLRATTALPKSGHRQPALGHSKPRRRR